MSWTYLKNTTLLTELNALARSREASTSLDSPTHEVSDSMHYVLSTSWHAHSKLHRGECARELFLDVAHDGCRVDEIVKDGPYDNGSYCATTFLGY